MSSKDAPGPGLVADGYVALMTSPVQRVTDLLREAGDLHHKVYRIVDGADDDWASWYAHWLVTLSELPDLVPRKPARSELTWLLVQLGRDYAAASPDASWEDWYAPRIVEHFGG